jgi:hypothetical protein
MDSRTLHTSAIGLPCACQVHAMISQRFWSYYHAMQAGEDRRLHGSSVRCEQGPAYHSTVTYLMAFPPVLATSFCILVAARPQPRFVLAAPSTTCVTVLRPSTMELRPPWADSMCLNLWSETRGAVEPFTKKQRPSKMGLCWGGNADSSGSSRVSCSCESRSTGRESADRQWLAEERTTRTRTLRIPQAIWSPRGLLVHNSLLASLGGPPNVYQASLPISPEALPELGAA